MATSSAQSPSRPATGMDAAKKTLRRQVAAAVRALDAAAIAEQSARIAANVRALPEFANARALSVYLHMPTGEAQTTQLLAAAFGAGKKVYVPKIMGRTADDLKMVHALSLADVAAFPKDKWLIPDPPLATPDDVPRDDPILEQDLELVLLPGVAFDRRGGRLGHGKAYYDCFLRRLAEFYQDYHRPMPTLVGICLTPQLIEDVPVDEHDHTLDIIVTPDEAIRVLST